MFVPPQTADIADRETPGKTALERVRTRYEETEKKCPECGHVDEEGNWESRIESERIVYRHVCPACEAAREHVFDLGK